jgi:hypothetical protein
MAFYIIGNMSSIAPENNPELIMPAPRNLREDIMDVFSDLGGTSAMLTWVKASTANERIFYSIILPKVIPKQVEGSLAHSGTIKQEYTWSTDPKLDVANLICKDAGEKPAASILSLVDKLAGNDDT